MSPRRNVLLCFSFIPSLSIYRANPHFVGLFARLPRLTPLMPKELYMILLIPCHDRTKAN